MSSFLGYHVDLEGMGLLTMALRSPILNVKELTEFFGKSWKCISDSIEML